MISKYQFAKPQCVYISIDNNGFSGSQTAKAAAPLNTQLDIIIQLPIYWKN